MNSIAHDLRSYLESRDFSGFLDAFEAVSRSSERPPAVTAITQRILPPLLKAWLMAGHISSNDLVRTWRLIRSSQLLIIDNDILEEINGRLAAAWKEVEGSDAKLPEPLMTFSATLTEPKQKSNSRAHGSLRRCHPAKAYRLEEHFHRGVSEVIGSVPQIAPKKHAVGILWQGGMRCCGRPM